MSVSKKVFIFGAGGYLGGALYEKLSSDDGYDTYGFFRQGDSDNRKFVIDVMETYKIAKLLGDLTPDIIVWSIANKSDELSVSEIGLRNILNCIPKSTRFIYISSTISSAQNQSENVMPELRKPDQYLADYVNGKIVGEYLVRSNLNHVIVRPGQIFGFDTDRNPDVRMERILAEKEKDGICKRSDNDHVSIIHIDDMVDCICELCASDFVGVLNVASNPPVSYYDFYRLLAKMLGIGESIIVPYHSEVPANAYFDLTKCNYVLQTQIRSYSELWITG